MALFIAERRLGLPESNMTTYDGPHPAVAYARFYHGGAAAKSEKPRYQA